MSTHITKSVQKDLPQTWASFQIELRAARRNRTDLAEAHPKFYAEPAFSYFRLSFFFENPSITSTLSSGVGFCSRHQWICEEDELVYDLCEREWLTSDEGFSRWNQHHPGTIQVSRMHSAIGWFIDEDN